MQLLFHPVTRDEPIYHSIMTSKDFLRHENAFNALIAVSTPEMLQVADKDGLTALHLACIIETVPDSVVHALIQAGAHLDTATPSNRTPLECCISELSPQYLAVRSYYPLKLACLSARIIVDNQLPTETLPALFNTFIDFHRTAPSKGDEYISLSPFSS
ncbi:fem-1-like protein [Oopsacas minuta]|uniref:Fem-1-like protein n=1 Tax=Oopsacas minuta TaxID=111878 RepID=A0AAV7JZA0_9METZ|nr:fem-1-like protein [Oopsacas minuta]